MVPKSPGGMRSRLEVLMTKVTTVSEWDEMTKNSRARGGKIGAEMRKRNGSKVVDSYLPKKSYGVDRVKPWEL